MKEIVVKISDGLYECLQNAKNGSIAAQSILTAVKDGFVLPEHNGRIGDVDALLHAMKKRDADNGGEPLNAVDRGYHLAVEHLKEEIDNLFREWYGRNPASRCSLCQYYDREFDRCNDEACAGCFEDPDHLNFKLSDDVEAVGSI